MKKVITKSITIITMLAIVLTMAMPMTAQAATKKKAALNKKSVTFTMTKKKAKPTVTLKVKNVKKLKKAVKWTTTNKKVVTVKRTGKYTCKVVARKAGRAVVKCKVNGRTLTCKVTVKDKRKSNDKKPKTPVAPTPAPTPVENTCEHEWNMFEPKLAKVPMDENCWHVDNGPETEYILCGICCTPYKNTNVAYFAATCTCPNNPYGQNHGSGSYIFPNGKGFAPDQRPTEYYIVADGQCTKCGTYHECDEYK